METRVTCVPALPVAAPLWAVVVAAGGDERVAEGLELGELVEPHADSVAKRAIAAVTVMRCRVRLCKVCNVRGGVVGMN